MITRAQMRRQLRAKGGIMNAVPRQKYGIGDFVRKLIPNELANIAVKAAPFVAPFNPGIAAAMRGIGRYDQRGDFKDALKQGLGTYVGGQGLRMLGGAGAQQNFFGTAGDRFTSPLSSSRTTSLKNLFKGGEKSTDLKESTFFDDATVEGLDKVKTPATGKGVGFIRDATGLFKEVPILKDLPSLVQQQILVGGATSAATYLYSAFIAEEPPQQEGETMKEYLDRRKVNVGKKMRSYFDNYFKFDKEYSSLDDAGKDAFVARYNMMSGGRAGYQTGGITMANTLAENMRRNLANQQAVSQQFQAARSRLPGYVAPQKIPAPTPTPIQEGSLGPIGKFPTPPGGDVQPILPVMPDQPPPVKIQPMPIDAPTKIIQPGPGGIDNLLPDLYEKVVAPAPAQPSTPPRVVKKPIDIVDFYEKVTQPILEESDEGTLGPITKLPVEPDPDTPIDELIRPIMPTLPVEPMTGQDIMEGFAKFKEQNPGAGMGPGLQVMIDGVLPDGTPLTFNNSAQASAFNQYLESIGQPPFKRVSQTAKLAPMGIMPPMAPEGGGEFPGGIMIDGKKYFSEQEAIKDMGIERYNQFMANGGRVGLMGGSMPMGEPRVNQGGITELDFRAKGGFVPVGIKEKADDVPAMLSKNEFVFTADAVRGAGNGSVEKGAQKMYDTMKNLERRVT
jgi:hypothetical protein